MDKSLAILGGHSAFPRPIPVGQIYFPEWERYEASMRSLFGGSAYKQRPDFATELERCLGDYFGAKHVICVSNATIGLMMAVRALEIKGKVILPSFTFIASAQSLIWNNIEPLFCEVDQDSYHLDPEHLEQLVDEDVSAIMGVNLWGDARDHNRLEAIALQHGLHLYYDSAHAFGCSVGDRRIGTFGELEVFSFHATKMLSATEGACIVTDHSEIASKVKMIRDGTKAQLNIFGASKLHETHAAIALMSLEDLNKNKKNNKSISEQYATRLKDLGGIKIFKTQVVTDSNHAYFVCQIDEKEFGLSRDQLLKVLESENVHARKYFYPGAHKRISNPPTSVFLPVTEKLCSNTLQLPVGATTDEETVNKICNIIITAQKESKKIRELIG